MFEHPLKSEGFVHPAWTRFQRSGIFGIIQGETQEGGWLFVKSPAASDAGVYFVGIFGAGQSIECSTESDALICALDIAACNGGWRKEKGADA